MLCRAASTLGRMDADHRDNEQLNAIIGVALRALVDAGAEPAFLGSFVDRYRSEFAKQLDIPAQSPPDLNALIVSAVAEAVGVAGVAKNRRGRKTQQVNVLVNGQRTSVTVRKDRLHAVEQLVGGHKEARRVVQQFASQVPAEVETRSTWIDAQLQNFIQLRESAPESPQRH
jgi:Flp pilus assembly CpaF family ATPase